MVSNGYAVLSCIRKGRGKMNWDTTVVRRHMRFTGRVQGVGFRYRAKYAANGMGITGWAKNEADGSVTLEAQGTVAQINMMLKMINKSDYIVIDTIDTKDIPLEEYETGFFVR